MISTGTISRFRIFLDSNYHNTYTEKRKNLQNQIILEILNIGNNSLIPAKNAANWLIFTAGPMGVGKSTTIEWMLNRCYDEFKSTVVIDMDKIRDKLPEATSLKQSTSFVESTQKECGLIAELCVYDSLYLGKSVIVDGSMINIPWQMDYIKRLKEYHPTLKVILLHITANEKEIRQRLQSRQRKCADRTVPEQMIVKSLQLKSYDHFQQFSSVVDQIIGINNSEDNHNGPTIVQPWYMTWEKLFQELFPINTSTCQSIAMNNNINDDNSNTFTVSAIETEESLHIITQSKLDDAKCDMPQLKFLTDASFELEVSNKSPTKGSYESISLYKKTINDKTIDDDRESPTEENEVDITFQESYNDEDEIEIIDGIDTCYSIGTIDMDTLKSSRGGARAVVSDCEYILTTTTTEEVIILPSKQKTKPLRAPSTEEGYDTMSLLMAMDNMDIKETRVCAYSKKLSDTGNSSGSGSASYLSYSCDSLRYQTEAPKLVPQRVDTDYFSASESTAFGTVDCTASTASQHMVMITDYVNNADNEEEECSAMSSHTASYHDIETNTVISNVSCLFSDLKEDIDTLMSQMTTDNTSELQSSHSLFNSQLLQRSNKGYKFVCTSFPAYSKPKKTPVSVFHSPVSEESSKKSNGRRKLATTDNAATGYRKNAQESDSAYTSSTLSDSYAANESLVAIKGKRKRGGQPGRSGCVMCVLDGLKSRHPQCALNRRSF